MENKISQKNPDISMRTKLNIGIMYLFNLFCEYYYGFWRKTYIWQCKLYVYFAQRARCRDLSFFDLTARTNDGLEVNIHKALIGKNLLDITHTSDIYDESMRCAIFANELKNAQKNHILEKQNSKSNDFAEDITYYLRFFASYYPHTCEDLKEFLEELNFDVSKPLNITFRLENSGKTYYLVIDLKSAKNLLQDKKFAFGEIDFANETKNYLH